MELLHALARLVTDEDGQDLIEYALLSAAIGLAGVAVFNGIGTAMQTAYGNWLTRGSSAADMPDPVP